MSIRPPRRRAGRPGRWPDAVAPRRRPARRSRPRPAAGLSGGRLDQRLRQHRGRRRRLTGDRHLADRRPGRRPAQLREHAGGRRRGAATPSSWSTTAAATTTGCHSWSTRPAASRKVIDVAELSGLADGRRVQRALLVQPADRCRSWPTRSPPTSARPTRRTRPSYPPTPRRSPPGSTSCRPRPQAIGADAPRARVAVTEPVPGYLIETAGLTDATPPEFAEAIEEDTDPPAAVLAADAGPVRPRPGAGADRQRADRDPHHRPGAAGGADWRGAGRRGHRDAAGGRDRLRRAG